MSNETTGWPVYGEKWVPFKTVWGYVKLLPSQSPLEGIDHIWEL